MNISQLKPQRYLKYLLCLLAGSGITLSLAPFDYWPLGLVGLSIFYYYLLSNPNQLSSLSFAFGFGTFSTGASWVYVSIHDFGLPSVPLASAMTLAFTLGLGLVFCLPFWLYQLFLRKRQYTPSHWALAISLAAVFSLGEWSRSWLLSGFPWLYSGYAHLNTPLAGWAPIGSVFLVGLVLSLSAAAIATNIVKTDRPGQWLLACCAALWGLGAVANTIQWSQNQGQKITVGMVQANIPQHLKWRPSYRNTTLERYWSMSSELWQYDWVIWPEAAIPIPYHRAQGFFKQADSAAKNSNSALISGLIYDHQEGPIYNSAIGLGKASGLYHKRHLVPFGEYIPLSGLFGNVFKLFNLPTPGITLGPEPSGLLSLPDQQLKLQPLICYEVVYPELGRQAGQQAVLITISNDAWFGHSIGPLQHLQMAQMRALENQRYLIRATNNGVSAIIDPRGKLTAVSEQFKQQNLVGEVWAREGLSLFSRLGLWTYYGAILVLLGLFNRRRLAA